MKEYMDFVFSVFRNVNEEYGINEWACCVNAFMVTFALSYAKAFLKSITL